MSNTKRVLVVTLVMALLLLGVMVPFASAQPVVIVPNGLVNVTIGRIEISDVNVNVAAQIAAAICAQDVNVLAIDAGAGDVTCDIGASNRDLVISND